MTRKLRIQSLLIQPVLVWDDGEDLAPGPEVSTATVPRAQAAEFLDGLPAHISALESQVLEAERRPGSRGGR